MLVSAGTVEANRGHGFCSPVLLDQSFATSGARGTPYTLLVDAEGRQALRMNCGIAGKVLRETVSYGQAIDPACQSRVGRFLVPCFSRPPGPRGEKPKLHADASRCLADVYGTRQAMVNRIRYQIQSARPEVVCHRRT